MRSNKANIGEFSRRISSFSAIVFCRSVMVVQESATNEQDRGITAVPVSVELIQSMVDQKDVRVIISLMIMCSDIVICA